MAFFNDGASIPTSQAASIGRRRRRAELSPSTSPEYQCHSSASLTHDPTRAATALGGLRGAGAAVPTHVETSPPARLSPALVRKLETIDHIIARADGWVEAAAPTTVHSPARGVAPSTATLGQEAVELTEPATLGQDPRANSPISSHSRRKVSFLLKQDHSIRRRASKRNEQETSPPQRGRVSALSTTHQLSTRYLITAPDTTTRTARTTSQRALAPIAAKQESQRALNNARVLEFVDTANNQPRTIATTSLTGATTIVSLDKQLRRISLVSFEQANGRHATTRRLLARTDSSLAMRRKQMFGIYSIREVMAVIRLFWFLDADRSGGITLDELVLHRSFFTKLGRTDLTGVFHELDVDGNGSVALNELLRVCFRHANDHQLHAMLTLAKVGDLHTYLTGRHSAHDTYRSHADDANSEHRKELMEIFQVFDRNGDGKINRDELLDALEIDPSLFAPALLETVRGAWAENARRLERAQAGGLTRKDIDRFYRECDKDSDDVLDFDEFTQLLNAAAS